MDRLKLKWRVFAFLVGFCALLLVILWLMQTVFLTDMYKYIRTKEIEKATMLVGENIDSPDLQGIFRELAEDKEIFVVPTMDFVPPQRTENNNNSNNNNWAVRGRPQPMMFETITKEKEFVLRDGRTISLTFHAMVTPVDATVSTLQTQLYIITAIMLLLAVALAAIISKRISKPIEDINKSAKVLAGGNYDTHFGGRGFLEIKELSDTLNTAARELSKVENLRRELMANVSHDLRTPLSLIYSYAEMMHDFPEEITPQQTQTIMDETKRLTSIVNDILEISRVESGGMLHRSDYCLTENIASTVRRTNEFVKADGYAINFVYDDKIYVNADEVKITQALYNLLVNAVNYGGEKDKTITVRQTVSGGRVKIEVTDNGEGISPENLPYVWDRYYKVDKKHKRAVTGTGLGLSIVKKIIDLHGGRYGVESEAGKGSTFWFEIACGTMRNEE